MEQDQIRDVLASFGRLTVDVSTLDDRDDLYAAGLTSHASVNVNGLKVAASTLVVDIVGRAMLICGIAGYREDSEYSLGRQLRDAYGAALMVNNDRIIGNSAQLLLVHKD